jgi:hypothetical protein
MNEIQQPLGTPERAWFERPLYPTDAFIRRENLLKELESTEGLSQVKIYSNVLELNRLSVFLVEEGEEDIDTLNSNLRHNYHTGLSRIITHPDFNPDVPNFFATELSRGLQQQERLMQEQLQSPPPTRRTPPAK